MITRLLYSSLLLCLALAPPLAAEDYKTLYRQARLQEIAGEYQQAVSGYTRAIQASRAQHPDKAAKIFYILGGLQQRLGELAAAEAAFSDSLALRKQLLGEEHPSVALSLNALGTLYYQAAAYARAENLFQQALALDEKLLGNNHPNVAIRLNNLAETYRMLADYEKAEPLYQRALQIDHAEFGDNSPRVAIRLSNLAELYREQGKYMEAKTLLEQALQIDQANALRAELPPENVGVRLNNLGRLYRTLGNNEKALEYYQQALAIWEKTPGRESDYYVAGLSNRGWALQGLKRYPAAEADYRAALKIQQALHGEQHQGNAVLLNNIGLLALEQGDYAQAETALQQAASQWEAVFNPYHPSLAATLVNQARLADAREQFAVAETLLQRALAIAQTAHQAELLWVTQYEMSRVLAHQQEALAAILFGKQAVNALQQLRVGLARMDKELQRRFLEDKAKAYIHLINLLMDKGRLEEAQQVQRMLKEEEYFDFVRREQSEQAVRATNAAYTPQERPWAERASRIYQRFHDLGVRLRHWQAQLGLSSEEQTQRQQVRGKVGTELLALQRFFSELKQALREYEETETLQTLIASGRDNLMELAESYRRLSAKLERSQDEQEKLKQLRVKMKQARQAFNLCLNELQAQQRFAHRNLDTLTALQGTLHELGHGAALLHYMITPTRVRMILTTQAIQICRESTIQEEDLEQQIIAFRTSLSELPQRSPGLRRQQLERLQQQARQLYELLLGPVAEDLREAGVETLMLSPDGRLRYLPFGALHDGERYMAQRYALIRFTEAARDKLKDRPKDDWQVYGLGLSDEVPGFNPLPSVKAELEGIIRRDKDDPDGIMPGAYKLNRTFNADTLADALEYRYPVLHIASHFVFQPSTDQDSYLLLGDGKALSLADIRTGYSFNGVDLLTLSACQTAVGSSTKGREVECFGALAQKQGAKSVLATLWPVDDRSTGLFMQRLYQIYRTTPGMTKADALRLAQQEFIEAADTMLKRRLGGLQSDAPDYPLSYEHPYHWGPFILMGNWL